MKINNINIQLHKKQADFIFSKDRMLLFLAGVRSGKTYAGVIKGILISLQHPNITGAVIAPTYPMVRNVVVRLYLQLLNNWRIPHKYNKNEHILTFYNGSQIFFLTAKIPEHLQGMTLDWVHLDEAALMTENIFRIAKDRILKPQVLDKGIIFLTTTPWGLNWVYHAVLDKIFSMIHCKTVENPFIDREEVEHAKKIFPEKYFRQMYEASFETHLGLVYNDFDLKENVIDKIDYNPDYETYVGIDFGWNEPTAVLWMQYDKVTGNWYIIQEFVSSYVRPETLAKILKGEEVQTSKGKFKAKVGMDKVIYYLTGHEVGQRRQEADGRSMLVSLTQYGIPRHKIRYSKHNMVESIMSVRGKIKSADGTRHLFVDSSCKTYINDKMNWGYPTKEGDYIGDYPDMSPANHKYSHTNDAERYVINFRTPLKARGWSIG